MPWARASSLDRHIACPAASHLPMVDRGVWRPGYLSKGAELFSPLPEPDLRDDSAAQWGTEMHAAKAGEPTAQDPWLVWMNPHRERLWPRRLGEHEVSVSYDCRTKSVELFRSASEDERTRWKMSRGPDCVVGTPDWWAVLPTGEPWVDDLKTGWRQPDVVTPQMLFALMARMKEPDVAGWNTGRVSITWCPRAQVPEGEEPPPPTREGLWRQLSKAVVDAFEEELHWAWVRACVTPNPIARPGGHCLYCPSLQVCDKANQ